MIGIITARGIVEGSLPPASERHKFHRVAYTGRVPVKLIGTWAVNDVVVPSGFNDGTAIAKPLRCRCGHPLMHPLCIIHPHGPNHLGL